MLALMEEKKPSEWPSGHKMEPIPPATSETAPAPLLSSELDEPVAETAPEPETVAAAPAPKKARRKRVKKAAPDGKIQDDK